MSQKTKQYKSTVREALARLLRDALELNDRQNISLEERQELEDEILDDFLAVLDYIRYIELKANYDEYEDSAEKEKLTQKKDDTIN